jgi:hypothetical protein
MPPFDINTPDERFHELARLLAAAFLRLRARAALPPQPSVDSSANCLEVPGPAVLSVSRD